MLKCYYIYKEWNEKNINNSNKVKISESKVNENIGRRLVIKEGKTANINSDVKIAKRPVSRTSDSTKVK